MQTRKLFLKISIFLFINLFCFSACSIKAEQKSLTSQFDSIDSLIQQNQTADALKLLRKTEKKVYDSWSYIGIYKRYKKLGETESCEKILKKALKKNSENLELNAVFVNFLIHQNRIDDAQKYSEKLIGTKYGSLNSEVVLKKTFQEISNQKELQNYDFFTKKEFYNVYLEAYQGSKNPLWIKNCAIINLTNGLISNAAALNPHFYTNADDAYFWALVLYDAGFFYDAIEASKISEKYLNDYQNKNLLKVSPVKIYSLQSDSYIALSDVENAERERQKVIINIDNLKLQKDDENFLPYIYVNSAIYAKNQGNNENCADLLFYAVNHWKNFVPALILYADFAYESNLEREEDTEMKVLRKAGIQSLEMEKYDNQRKIPLSDALYRIDESLKMTKNPYLYIKKLDLRYKTDKSLSEKDKLADLWKLLEDTYSEDEKYKSLLMQYAITYLLNIKQEDEAYNLFSKYIIEHIDYDKNKDFWEQVTLNVSAIDLPMAELGAYFAVKKQRLNEAIRMYEYIVYESSTNANENEISVFASSASCMNLADLYFSYGRREKALEFYGKLAGRESNNKTRSNIYLRIAKIYKESGNIQDALRSAEYAISINPENVNASFLKDELRQ